MDQLRIDNKNDANRANERFMYREPIVLLTIICLSLLRVISTTVDQERYFAHRDHGSIFATYQFYSLINSLGVLPGVMLVPFILEIHGRKPTFILLFSVTLLTSILSCVPYQQPVAVIGNFITAMMKGSVLTITSLAICEYCGAKHRFAFLVAGNVVKICGGRATSLLYRTKVISHEWSFLSLIEALIALACLVLVFKWPESPYWLSQQGRVEESRAALLWLRAEGDAAQAELRALDASRRRPSPKLFWLAVLIATLFVTVSKCSSWASVLLSIVEGKHELTDFSELLRNILFCSCVLVISVLLVLVAYKMNRKLIYLVAVVVPFVIIYMISVWIYFMPTAGNALWAFHIILTVLKSLIECGPNMSFVLFIEFIPQKYYTYIACISILFIFASEIVFPFVIYAEVSVYVILPLLATLGLVAVGLLYWLLPETRNKNLLEIEKLYFSRLYHENPEQAVPVLNDVSRL